MGVGVELVEMQLNRNRPGLKSSKILLNVDFMNSPGAIRQPLH